MSKLLKIPMIVLLASILVPIATDVCEAVVIANWRFEPGNFLADSSGNGNTLSGTATQSADVANPAGGSGSALFNGTTDALRTVASLDLTSYSQLRVSFAIRNSGSLGSFGTVIEHSPNQNSNNGAIFVDVDELASGTGTATLKLGPPATQSHNIDQLPHFTSGTEWDLFQIDFNPTAANAADVVQVTRNGTLLGDTIAFGLHGTTTSQSFLNDIFYIGARGESSFFFNGNIDEILIEAPPFTVTAAVPEPSTFMMALIGLAGLIRCRRAAIMRK